MGAGQSGGVEIGGSPMGYQVLRVYPDSPGSKAGLKAYFDFIVAIGNTRFNKEDGSLREILKASVDQKIKMIVYNTRNKMVREVDIVPTTSWGGSGLLGVSIKHSSFDKADERVWHVTEVDPGSPAQQAGFKAMNDYVIGSDSILQENDDLYNLIEAHEGKALKLFVYNVETDNCREIICHPNSKWGGRGFLGCEFGHGLLHRIPFADIPVGGDAKRSTPTQQAVSVQQSPILSQQPSNGTTASAQQANLLQHQASLLNRPAAQPGQQLFQQALFNNNPNPLPAQQQQQQHQDLSKPVEAPSLPQLPQAPQTFAQLASAQFQAQQYQQQTVQIQQQQQLLDQQRQQLEEQQRQMNQLTVGQALPPTMSSEPPPSAPPQPPPTHQSYASERSPHYPDNYQQQGGPPLPPPLPPPAPPQQPPQQAYALPSQQSPPLRMSPPPPAEPPAQALVRQPPQYYQQQFVAQTQNEMHPPNPYQRQYPALAGVQSHATEHHHQMTSPQGSSSEPSLPPSIQTLPPPPTMYPPPPQAPAVPQQHHHQLQSQPPPPSQQQQPPSMFANQM